MTQRHPLTDRAIRESLGEDREAPADLSRSISDYARSTPQASGHRFVGRLALPPSLAGWRALAAAILVLVLLLALGMVGLVGSRPPRLAEVEPPVSPVTPSVAPSPTPGPTPGPPMPAGWSHVADPPRVDGDGVVVEYGDLLVIANAARGELAFLDPAAGDGGQIVARRTLGAPSRGLPMARTDAGWWVGVGGSLELVLFDPASRSVARRIPIGVEAYNLAVLGDILYVTDFGNGRLVRVDASTGDVTASVDLAQAAGVAVLADASVLVASRPGSLLEVDPVTLETLEQTTIQGDVMTLIPDGDRVIITRNNADRLSTINPDDLAAGEALADTRISAFILTDDAAWGIDWMSGEVLRLNRESFAIIERVPPLSDGQDGIALAAGDLWVEGTTADGPVVHRIRPPTP